MEKVMMKSYGSVAREVPTTLGPERKEIEDYPTVWQRLDELDVALEQMAENIDNLTLRLSGLMTEADEYPVPGPRSSNSNITSRVCRQTDFVDDMTRKLGDIRNRLTV